MPPIVSINRKDIKEETDYDEILLNISDQIEIKEFKPECDFDQEDSIVDDPNVIVVKHESEDEHDQDSNQEDPLCGC